MVEELKNGCPIPIRKPIETLQPNSAIPSPAKGPRVPYASASLHRFPAAVVMAEERNEADAPSWCSEVVRPHNSVTDWSFDRSPSSEGPPPSQSPEIARCLHPLAARTPPARRTPSREPISSFGSALTEPSRSRGPSRASVAGPACEAFLGRPSATTIGTRSPI